MERQDPLQTDGRTIRLDYTNMMSDSIGGGRGIKREEIEGLLPKASVIAGNIEAKRKNGEWDFYRLPYDTETVDEVLQLAASFRDSCDDFVLLGIGGSALGGKALFHALCHPLRNILPKQDRGGIPRIFFLDNIDPVTIKSVLDFIDPERTVFNVITKSGSTVETVSQFLIVRQLLADKLGKQSVGEHLVVTTGAGENRLRDIAGEEGYPLFSIQENVAGRFSVFSPVGLFPAAMSGIDIKELLAGARYADERCRTDRLWQNPAYLSGALYYLADVGKGLNINVIMPYSDALLQVAYWFRQLWAEGLGKAETVSGKRVNVGQTPVVALGTTDQHSQLQLYTEGPFNKMVTFLQVEKYSGTVPIPPQPEQEDEYSYLGGHSLEELIRVEARATQLALTEAGRSNMSLIIPEINAFIVGQLLFMLEVQTVFTAGLYDINPMDQPGVEASKRYIYGMMGRRGFGDTATGAEESQAGKGRYIV